MTQKKFFVWAVIIALAHIGLVLFFGMNKNGFHEDEYYTYWSVSTEDVSPANFTWHTGYELQSRFFVKDGEQFSFRMVAANQAEDVHPPLYYLALHVLMSLFADSFYKWFGILLNLMFSLVTYAGVVCLFYFVSDEAVPYKRHLALVAGGIYAVAPSTISCVMLTRMYAMSTMWGVLYAVVFVLLMKNTRCSRRRFTLLTLAGALICYLTFLTHYFSMLVPFFLTFAYCIRALVKRTEIGRMLVYGVSMVAAVLLAICTYPACLSHIFDGYRGTGAIEGLFGGALPARVELFVGYMDEWIFSRLLVPCMAVFLVCLIALVVLAWYTRNKRQGVGAYIYRVLVLTVTCLLSFILLSGTALMVGAASCRYFYPIAAITLPLMGYVVCVVGVLAAEQGEKLHALWEKKLILRVVSAVAVLGLLLVPIVKGFCMGNVLFLYEEEEEKIAFSQAHSQYPLIMVYDREKDYRSWYVDAQLWPFEHILYMEYQYKDQLEDKWLAEAEKIVVYMDAPLDLLDKLIADNDNLSKYTLVRHDPFFYVYLLE